MRTQMNTLGLFLAPTTKGNPSTMATTTPFLVTGCWMDCCWSLGCCPCWCPRDSLLSWWWDWWWWWCFDGLEGVWSRCCVWWWSSVETALWAMDLDLRRNRNMCPLTVSWGRWRGTAWARMAAAASSLLPPTLDTSYIAVPNIWCSHMDTRLLFKNDAFTIIYNFNL